MRKRKKIKYAIASYTNEFFAEQTIAALCGMTDFLLQKYQDKKNIYHICSLLLEKHGNMWYGRCLELPQAYTRSYFYWLCILKLKIMCSIDMDLVY